MMSALGKRKILEKNHLSEEEEKSDPARAQVSVSYPKMKMSVRKRIQITNI